MRHPINNAKALIPPLQILQIALNGSLSPIRKTKKKNYGFRIVSIANQSKFLTYKRTGLIIRLYKTDHF